jgi:hypothetical protein
MVDDVLFDYEERAERNVYNSVGRYIDKRFAELEREKPGKGFVMTIYRRRASSSPVALERSLGRRLNGLRRVAERKAYDPDLDRDDEVDPRDLDDLAGFEAAGRLTSALPADPNNALAESREVERVLEELQALRGRDSKRDRFFDVLRRVTDDGRAVLIFTEYADTLEYLRDNLVAHYGKSLGCYRGGGGQLWDGAMWKPVTKDVITRALRERKLQALVCTDAASEGLNLQAAGAVINYDLPWNPSKIEQRIGRIDRIGQALAEVLVVNLFLKDSVDDKVYRALRTRCGLFEHFVGAMQPVLARARRMLLGQEPTDLDILDRTAKDIERDPLAEETYVEALPTAGFAGRHVLTRTQVTTALEYLNSDFGLRIKTRPEADSYVLWGSATDRHVFASTVQALERDRNLLPLSPFVERLRELASDLQRPGERLPLVIGTAQSGAFRVAVPYWVGNAALSEIDSFEELEERVREWDGTYPDPKRWLEAEQAGKAEAQRQVALMQARALAREREGLERQVSAAKLRLQSELGRYLASLEAGTSDLNGLLYQQISRDIASAGRLRQCLERLGGYPDWPLSLVGELQEFSKGLTDNQRRARLFGKELDAALDDPRWAALTVLKVLPK